MLERRQTDRSSKNDERKEFGEQMNCERLQDYSC